MTALRRPIPQDKTLGAALAPRSIAVIGASDNPNKIGGRPIAYLRRFGFAGEIYPINPNRAEVQGIPALASIAAIPDAPDLAIIAVPGEDAVAAVEACAAKGVAVAVVMASGFAEVGGEGAAAQARMISAARAAGMRLIGPNTQGIANFANGAVASFATMIGEVEPATGPVAIVSQSGAMSVVPYTLLRQRGIGVKHSHATGNEADVTVADFALAVAQDPDVRLLLLYMEAIADPATLEEAARIARARDVPIVALKAGRSRTGQAAAASHTGALATEDRVVDAFLKQLGIWRADDMAGLVNATELYLKGWRPTGRNLVSISNSGASGVMAADFAEVQGLPLAQLAPATRTGLAAKMPGFASGANPIDLTAALLTNSGMFSDILPILAADPAADLFLITLPILGAGYAIDTFARDATAVATATGKPVVAAIPHTGHAATFRASGVPTFADDNDAVKALAQIADHAALMRKPIPTASHGAPLQLPMGASRMLSEYDAMHVLGAAGFPLVEHALCRNEDEALLAFAGMAGPVVVKACSSELPHKSELGLVFLNCRDEAAVRHAFRAIADRTLQLDVKLDGVIVARMVRGRAELMLGARRDPQFGVLVMFGAGGKYVEALADTALLRHPFDPADAADALRHLHLWPLLAGLRGDAPIDPAPFAQLAASLGAAVAATDSIASIDLNPVMATDDGTFVVVDALIERSASD